MVERVFDRDLTINTKPLLLQPQNRFTVCLTLEEDVVVVAVVVVVVLDVKNNK